MLAIKTILHPSAFSECSELAFQLACSLARDYTARLIVLHVFEPPKVPTSDSTPVSAYPWLEVVRVAPLLARTAHYLAGEAERR